MVVSIINDEGVRMSSGRYGFMAGAQRNASRGDEDVAMFGGGHME